MVRETVGQRQDYRQVDRQVYKERHPGGQVGVWTDSWQQRGCCPTQALAREAELATRLNFQFLAPVLGPGKRPGSRAFMGSFLSREEQATAVNSLIPTACPVQALMVAQLSQPMCLRTWHLLSPREPGCRGTGCPESPWLLSSPQQSQDSRAQAQRGKEPQWCPDSHLLGVVPLSNSLLWHPQSWRILRISGAKG